MATSPLASLGVRCCSGQAHGSAKLPLYLFGGVSYSWLGSGAFVAETVGFSCEFDLKSAVVLDPRHVLFCSEISRSEGFVVQFVCKSN